MKYVMIFASYDLEVVKLSSKILLGKCTFAPVSALYKNAILQLQNRICVVAQPALLTGDRNIHQLLEGDFKPSQY